MFQDPYRPDADGMRATLSPGTPLLGWRGAALALLCAFVLCWPMLATGGYLIYTDTFAYVDHGWAIWASISDMLGIGAAPDPEAAEYAGDPASDYAVRSFVYAIYVIVAGAGVWPAGFAMLQAAITLYALMALIGPEAASRPKVLGAGFAMLAAFSTLPWFTAYLMPDILAATIVIYAVILARKFDELSGSQRITIGIIATFAVAAHYGNGPLAAALFAAILLWRLIRGRLTVAVTVAAILPVLVSPLGNLGASSVAMETSSTTPLRLPILLARSIEDGPARWYLQDACPDAPLAFCEAFGDEVPTNIAEFLWREDGISSLTPDQMARIRDQELLVLARAFRAYPVAQSVSLFENAALQMVRVGTGNIILASWDDEYFLGGPPRSYGYTVITAFDLLTPAATLAAFILLLGLLLTGRLRRQEIEMFAVVVLGLVVNAAIFGGLSAPVDRYQSRVAWLLPALAVIFVARIAGSVTPPRSSS